MEATLSVVPSFSRTTRWLVVATAGFGFAFDLYEMVVQAIVLRPMLMELGPFQPGTPAFNHWAGLALFVPPVVGGLASLAGGYLTDRLGRQRVLVWSIVIYGGAAFMSGLATSLTELLFWRCVVVAGICVEFVAALAWLTELFPETYRRERVLALAQACATLGNFMIAGAYLAAVNFAEDLPAVHGGHAPWRYTLLFGVVPAIPLMILRPFLPESPLWLSRRTTGTLPRTRIRELFEPRLRRVTILSTLLVGCCYALAFGMMQHIPRVVPGLPGVAELARKAQEQFVSFVHFYVDTGAILGRLLFVGLAIYVIARRRMLQTFLLLGLGVFPFVFLGPPMQDIDLFKYAVVFASVLVSAQYSFWGNYLPRVFPLHLRGTGAAFGASIGGRVIAPMAALATTQLSNLVPGASPTAKLATSMALVVVTFTLLALLLSTRLPEPAPELPED
ncbi:MAG TPA: MFS transporter [Steroidobacteraceae bacterium]|nr:MFS transporter [Steroidobacteraceae bacterium]